MSDVTIRLEKGWDYMYTRALCGIYSALGMPWANYNTKSVRVSRDARPEDAGPGVGLATSDER